MLGSVRSCLLGISKESSGGLNLPSLETLIAYYPCNEGNGTDIFDLSGNDNHATLIGGGWGSMVSSNTAVDFYQTGSDRITTPAGVATSVGTWTISMVVELDNINYNPNKQFYGCGVYLTNYVGAARTVTDLGLPTGRVYYQPNPNSGAWSGSHYAGITASTETLFINRTNVIGGTTLYMKPLGGALTKLTSTQKQYNLSYPFVFGNNPYNTANLDGRIRDLVIWDSDLSDDDITSLVSLY